MEKTKNYGFPQYEGNDLTDWYELNQPFETIDTELKANAEAAETAQQTADSNTASIANLTESLNNTIGRVTKNEQNITALDQQTTLNTTHLNEHDTAIQTLETEISAIENTIGGSENDGTIIASLVAIKNDVSGLEQEFEIAKQNIATNSDNIGDLNGLKTTSKTNIVAAINECVQNGETIDKTIGNLSDLETNTKENIVAAMNEIAESAITLEEGKISFVLSGVDDSVRIGGGSGASGVDTFDVIEVGNERTVIGTIGKIGGIIFQPMNGSFYKILQRLKSLGWEMAQMTDVCVLSAGRAMLVGTSNDTPNYTLKVYPKPLTGNNSVVINVADTSYPQFIPETELVVTSFNGIPYGEAGRVNINPMNELLDKYNTKVWVELTKTK